LSALLARSGYAVLVSPRRVARGVVSESAGGRKPKTVTFVFGNVHGPLLLATFESLSARH